jgi:isoquinoline 1-oxidoreductase beta subunit
VIGGVAFGIYAYKKPAENPLLANLKDGQAALTPFVKIDANGIMLITPHTDFGQGAYHVQAALIAEELDVDPLKVRVDPGMPSPAYYNTALANDAVPFEPTDESVMADSARTVVDAMMKFLGMQITGGSSSVADSFHKLRIAGAVARETIKAAASQQTGVPVAQLKTQDGKVIMPDGTQLRYESLASLAATLAPVSDVTLRSPDNWKYLGKTMQRLDMVAKCTGTQKYGIDVAMDGMVYATVKTNPRRGGTMNGYDASSAEKMRGVHQIVPIKGGVGVIGDNTWRVIQAANAIVFDWGPAPYPAEMDDHWKTLSDSFVDDRVDSRLRDDGDTDAALTQGSVITAQYRAPYLAHQPLEPLTAIAKVTDERVDVWAATQIPRFSQGNIATLTGVDFENVFVHVLMAGGSFGHRLEDAFIKQAVELAMAVKGTPVKLTYSREEDFAQDFPRQIAMARAKGTVKDGNVETYDLAIAMPSVITSQMGRQGFPVPGPDFQIVAGAWEQPFAIPNYRVTGYRAPELAPISSWRSVGASSNGFFHDCGLDELIHAAGADPLAERMRLCWHEPSRKVLEAVKEMSGWNGPHLGENRGRGVAFCLSFGVPVAQIIDVTNTPAGIRIDNVFVAADVGTVLDPVNFENIVQGGVVWALGHAMNCEITYSDGMVEQSNFHDHAGMRLHQCPVINVRALENATHIKGIGEPPVPPAAAALANAIFAATGQRIREMPFNKFVNFV